MCAPACCHRHSRRSRNRVSGIGKEGTDYLRSVSHPGPWIASLEEIAETARVVGDANYFLVKNFVNNTTFFEWDPATYNSYFKKIKAAEEITIPKLNEMAYEQVEVASVPFVSFVGNKGRKAKRRTIRSFFAAMCAIGSAMSGVNTIR